MNLRKKGLMDQKKQGMDGSKKEKKERHDGYVSMKEKIDGSKKKGWTDPRKKGWI